MSVQTVLAPVEINMNDTRPHSIAAGTKRSMKRFPTSHTNNNHFSYPIPELPPLDWEWGYKFALNEETELYEKQQLNLLDILYPTGEELHMAQSYTHHTLANKIESTLQSYLVTKGWLIFGDVFVHWPWRQIPPAAPDITVVSEGVDPGKGSYYVGKHGVNPCFVLEITSPRNREKDFSRNRQDYEAVRVDEYLIIDLWPDKDDDTRLLGYSLKSNGLFYEQLQPDAEGGLSFESIGIRFVYINEQRIDLYDIATGERLLSPEEQMKARLIAERRAKTEAQRAEIEAKARAEAELRAAQAEMEVKRNLAQSMLNNGLPIDMIAQITGLTTAEIDVKES
jgi:Uma2 family endonuclease